MVIDGEGLCLLGGDSILNLELMGNIHRATTDTHILKNEFSELFSKCIWCYKNKLFALEIGS